MFHLVRGSAYVLLVHRSCDHFYIHCAYLWYIYIYMVYVFFTYLSMCCFFSLYTYASYFLYAIFYFYFTLRCRDKFCLKCFRNTGCQSLSCHLFLQNFSRVCVRIDFIIFNMWVWVEWFMTSLICSFVCCGFVTNCQSGRLLGHMWFDVRNICQIRIG